VNCEPLESLPLCLALLLLPTLLVLVLVRVVTMQGRTRSAWQQPWSGHMQMVCADVAKTLRSCTLLRTISSFEPVAFGWKYILNTMQRIGCADDQHDCARAGRRFREETVALLQ
jgi:hypothetical protein